MVLSINDKFLQFFMKIVKKISNCPIFIIIFKENLQIISKKDILKSYYNEEHQSHKVKGIL